MRVIQTVPDINNESSGPSYAVMGLCRGLHECGVEVELHVPTVNKVEVCGFRVCTYPRRTFFHLRGMEWSPDLKRGLIERCRTTDVIHSNGLWMIPNLYAARAVRGTACKLVTSPHGSFAAWSLARSRLKKRVMGWLWQHSALAATDMFHATSEKEYEEIRVQGYRQPVAIVPIGMDLPEVQSYVKEGVGRLRRIVFFGRIHKVKGIDRLVLAWERVAQGGWELVIAGPDCGMLEELKRIVAEGKIPRVSFLGEINGPAKYEFLARGDIYVLPSDTENFGVTVAEALVSGTPVIASQGTPWQGLERERCGRWVPVGVEPLAAALKEMMAMSDGERAAMGARGRAWIQRDFSWKGIGAQMKAAYAWLLGLGEKPEWVRIE